MLWGVVQATAHSPAVGWVRTALLGTGYGFALWASFRTTIARVVLVHVRLGVSVRRVVTPPIGGRSCPLLACHSLRVARQLNARCSRRSRRFARYRSATQRC